MSEFMEKHAVARLIGAPPGYVGYEEGGYLTEAVKRRPYSVLLLDEIEKAHPDVFNLLLQILDDGRLTDGHGKTVDFRNTVIIMTSNLASRYITEYGEEDFDKLEAEVNAALKETFKPEFLNRVDDILIFHSLSRDLMEEIVDIQLRHLKELLKDKKIGLELTAEARAWLADRGYDPAYGARALKRLLQNSLQDELAIRILEGEFREEDTVCVDLGKDGLVFTKRHSEGGAPEPAPA
ncbi:ClpB protein [hydrothermal vent metagenome]|uniref:ClpB protein n=1 Tax=hydrothermal vent metagenome TaxID=652676 RepID=A0A3B0W221_9ZZZZ